MADDAFHDQGDARRYRARLRRQRAYQANYRSKLKQARSPQKADFAAACFDEMLLILARNPDAGSAFVGAFLRRLSEQFDAQQAAARLTEMVGRTRDSMKSAAST